MGVRLYGEPEQFTRLTCRSDAEDANAAEHVDVVDVDETILIGATATMAPAITRLHISLHFHDQFSLCNVSLGLHGALTPPQILGSCFPSAGGLQGFPLA